MATSSIKERTVAEICQLVTDYDIQMRQAVEDGMESVRITMRLIGRDLVSKTLSNCFFY